MFKKINSLASSATSKQVKYCTENNDRCIPERHHFSGAGNKPEPQRDVAPAPSLMFHA
jgi:hypothetical protein